MRFLLFCLILTACSESEIKIERTNADSIIKKTENVYQSVSQANEKSEDLITSKVDKTVQKIQNLENEVSQLKKENNELKNKLDDINDGGSPFKLLPVSKD
jgi:uncharacterized coiled-coil DUF342 family protein